MNSKKSYLMNKLENITIICPTFNRPYMLDRTLNYYHKDGFDCRLIVADSSEDRAKELNLKMLSKYDKDLHIDYFALDSEVDFGRKLYEATKKVQTKYAIIMPDDDFLIRQAVEDSINTLDEREDIVSVYGNRLSISALSAQTSENNWIKLFPYSYISIEDESYVNRVKKLPVPSWWQFPYSVTRTAALIKATEIISDMKYTQFTEFFFYAAILRYGKWVKLNNLFALCNSDSDFYQLRERSSFKHYWGDYGSILAQTSQDFWSSHILSLSKRVAMIESSKFEEKDKLAKQIHSIYLSINNLYLENKGFSRNLLTSNFLSKNVYLLKLLLNKFLGILIFYDKDNGLNSWVNFFVNLLKEFIKGGFIKQLVFEPTFSNLKDILIVIKRTGSLNFYSKNLISGNSKYSKNFEIAFSLWKSNPCPKKYIAKK